VFDCGAVGDTEQGQARLLGSEHNEGNKEKTTNEKVDDGDYDVSGGVKWLCVTYISGKTEFGNA
jgi:hypothetical protein